MVLSSKAFIDRHFDAAMRIHALCFDKGISRDDARLYVYIHVKSLEAPDCLEGDCAVEIEALRGLLGISGAADVAVFDEPLTPETMKELVADVLARYVRKVEFDAQQEYGYEALLRPELERRLRLHCDPVYRNEQLVFYRNHILPALPAYNSEQVEASCDRERLQRYRAEEELQYLLK